MRGKNDDASRGWGSFQWTKAVRALLLLVCRELLLKREGCASVLTGERGSLAAALDLAVSREPLWLHQMFGEDLRGVPFSRRVFARSNPNFKKPGPGSIGFRRAILAEFDLQIHKWNAEGRATSDSTVTIKTSGRERDRGRLSKF